MISQVVEVDMDAGATQKIEVEAAAVADGAAGSGVPNNEFAMLLTVEMMTCDTVTVLVPEMPISSLSTSPKLFVVIAALRSEGLIVSVDTSESTRTDVLVPRGSVL